VHAALAAQGLGPLEHTPAAQTSLTVQGLPSSHAAVLAVFTQPVAGEQLSSVHTLPSSQVAVAPAHVPLVQTSSVVQSAPSLHAVPVRGRWVQLAP
jgi:hypothetical protein